MFLLLHPVAVDVMRIATPQRIHVYPFHGMFNWTDCQFQEPFAMTSAENDSHELGYCLLRCYCVM